MSEDFLSRWSRLKNEARRSNVGHQLDAARPAGDEALRPEPELSADEIAALPKLDELTAETDVAAFLRRGVPAPLRNAALRRMWMLDPTIRDFPGHARDYAYDWNTPGGVPGGGALGPDDDVVAMVRRLFGEPSEKRDTSNRLSSSDLTREPGSEGDMSNDAERKEPEPSRKPQGDDHA